MTTQTNTDHRLTHLTHWVNEQCPISNMMPLAGDASFRRYFRIISNNNSFIAMDAPPPRENCRPFLAISNDLRALGINTPKIIAADTDHGFLLLTDFGDTVLHSVLTETTADHWYERCLDQLILMQRHQHLAHYPLKHYNDGLYTYYEESSWFLTWYLQQHKKMTLSHQQLAQLERDIHAIAVAANQQPRVIVHRDFHSRNIMITSDETLGILDFQDAVIGPITYDLASLFRDCYIDWPVERIHHWLKQYHQRLITEHLITASFDEFLRWFDWIGLQRHLKCIGLFVRLHLRDNKPGYLPYLPRLFLYLKTVSARYPELSALHEILQ